MYEGDQPNRLKAAVVEVNSRSDCNKPHRYNGTVLSEMFCAGKFSGSNISDSCQVRVELLKGKFKVKLTELAWSFSSEGVKFLKFKEKLI
jgi:hypothetical protein